MNKYALLDPKTHATMKVLHPEKNMGYDPLKNEGKTWGSHGVWYI